MTWNESAEQCKTIVIIITNVSNHWTITTTHYMKICITETAIMTIQWLILNLDFVKFVDRTWSLKTTMENNNSGNNWCRIMKMDYVHCNVTINLCAVLNGSSNLNGQRRITFVTWLILSIVKRQSDFLELGSNALVTYRFLKITSW